MIRKCEGECGGEHVMSKPKKSVKRTGSIVEQDPTAKPVPPAPVVPTVITGRCHCCGYTDIELIRWTNPDGQPGYFCQICASTFLSDCITYPARYTGNEYRLFASLGWIANHILKEIRSLKDG